MSEAETLEMTVAYAANAILSFTVYLSFTFAFLTTAFLVGDRLTRFQAIAAAGIYITSAGGCAISVVANVQVFSIIMARNSSVLDEVPLYSGDLWLPMVIVVQSAGMLVSLYFLIHTRICPTINE